MQSKKMFAQPLEKCLYMSKTNVSNITKMFRVFKKCAGYFKKIYIYCKKMFVYFNKKCF